MRSRTILAIAGCFVIVAGVAGWAASTPKPAVVVEVAPIDGGSVEGQTVLPSAATTTSPNESSPLADEPTVDAKWLATTSTAVGIPPEALAAYGRAALVIGSVAPGCHLGWNTLAALGYVESAHGTIGGSGIARNGDVIPAIVGPVLDGGRYAAVPDTDKGLWDGDTRWDRAVGPLQFLPATWAQYGADGNGDGVADPDNIVDASLSAGDYLCAVAGDLSNASAWTAAIAAYNPNENYVERVRAAAVDYAARSRG